ncbi:MAG: ATP-binding protein [Prevotella sp.]|nr:ATP-binding protein [Prevotella sp.]
MNTNEQTVKQLPLGISDFERLRQQNFYYVDKTMFIPRLEFASSYLFLVRPRRFGKSLMLSMLKAYYDVNMKDCFDKLFGDLWIGSHPTPYKNYYAVLHLDFSQVIGSIGKLQENFDEYCGMVCEIFAQQYEHLFYDGFAKDVKEASNAGGKLNLIGRKAKMYGVPLYLIVDEYDNFTNTVLNQHGEDIYMSLTHGEGFYRDIFKIFKPNFERVLMLGVSPVTMDDLTSGYNIATNITAEGEFNQMLGFSEDDVRVMFNYYKDAGWLKNDVETMIEEMKPWYDNYCFAKEGLNDSRMFNSDMVLYYLGNQVRNGHSPDEMVNPNARTDYKKMKKLIQLDKLEPQRKSIIYQIAEQGYIDSTLVSYFPASEMVKFDNFVSLLYYYGMLTIAGTSGFMLRLGIPNNSVRKQYYGYLLEEYDRIRTVNHWQIDQAFQRAAVSGDWHPLVQTVSDEYEKTCAVRCLIEGERNIQGFFTAYFSLCPYYLTAPEVELNHGYCDFFLMPDLNRYPMVAHSYIIELKYLKTDDSEATAEEQWQQAREQLLRYAQDEKVRLLQANTQLHLVAAQFRTHQLVRAEEIGD